MTVYLRVFGLAVDEDGNKNYAGVKINIDTDLRLAMTASIREHLVNNPGDFDPRQYLKPARTAIQNMVQHKIKNVLNSSNKLQDIVDTDIKIVIIIYVISLKAKIRTI